MSGKRLTLRRDSSSTSVEQKAHLRFLRTKLHRPTTKFTQIGVADEFEEDRQTLRLMKEHGIDRVRGGSFSQVTLDESKRKVIEGMLRSSDDSCFNCGEKGHFARWCSKKKEVAPKKEIAVTTCGCCGRLWKTLPISEHWSKRQCNFCEYIGYDMYEDGTGQCARCGRESHIHKRCYARMNVWGKPCEDMIDLKKQERETGRCAKCGRESHTYKQCYAKTDRYGYRLKY